MYFIEKILLIIIQPKMIDDVKLTNEIGVDNGILISPLKKIPRQGWSEAFKRMHENNDFLHRGGNKMAL